MCIRDRVGTAVSLSWHSPAVGTAVFLSCHCLAVAVGTAVCLSWHSLAVGTAVFLSCHCLEVAVGTAMCLSWHSLTGTIFFFSFFSLKPQIYFSRRPRMAIWAVSFPSLVPSQRLCPFPSAFKLEQVQCRINTFHFVFCLNTFFFFLFSIIFRRTPCSGSREHGLIVAVISLRPNWSTNAWLWSLERMLVSFEI